MLHSHSVPRHLRVTLLRRNVTSLSRGQKRAKSTLEDTYQPPNATAGSSVDPRSSEAKPHRAFYKNSSLPVFKGFLMALFTYQVTYWGWLKLESLETQREKEAEVNGLEGQIRQLVGAKKST